MDRSERTGMSGVMKVALAWLAVGLPLLWGVVRTFHTAMALFR